MNREFAKKQKLNFELINLLEKRLNDSIEVSQFFIKKMKEQDKEINKNEIHNFKIMIETYEDVKKMIERIKEEA